MHALTDAILAHLQLADTEPSPPITEIASKAIIHFSPISFLSNGCHSQLNWRVPIPGT